MDIWTFLVFVPFFAFLMYMAYTIDKTMREDSKRKKDQKYH